MVGVSRTSASLLRGNTPYPCTMRHSLKVRTNRTMDPSRKITCTPQVPWDWVERRNPRHGRPDALTSAQYALFADAPEFGGHGPQGNYAYASPAEREQLVAACGK